MTENPRREQPSSLRTVGRDSELARVVDALDDTSCVTLTGPPGVGKTHVARAVAARCEVPIVELATADSPEGLYSVVAGAVGLREVSPEALGPMLRNCGDAFVVLDNAEHIAELVAACTSRWTAAGARFLVTSRVRLGVPGERVVPIAPLGVAAATTLLMERVRELGAPEHPPASLERLAAATDGLPLVVELAAPLLRILSPDQLAERLEEHMPRLSDAAPGGARRHASLRAAIDHSWQLLPAHARDLLLQLAVFRSEFTLDDVESIAAPSRETPVIESIRVLAEHSLVTTASASPMRLGLLDSIRQYASERLGESIHSVRRRRLSVLASRCAQWTGDATTRPRGEATAEIVRCLPELVAACQDSAITTEDAAAIAVAVAHGASFCSRSLVVLPLLRSAAARATEHALHGHAAALQVAISSALAAVDPDGARAAIREARAQAEASASPQLLARTLIAEARSDLRAGDDRHARHLIGLAVELLAVLTDRFLASHLAISAADVLVDVGDPEAVRDVLLRFPAIPGTPPHVVRRFLFAAIEQERGRLELAQAQLESITACGVSPPFLSRVRGHIAMLHAMRGDLRRAEELIEELAEATRRFGAQVPSLVWFAAVIKASVGQREACERAYAELCAITPKLPWALAEPGRRVLDCIVGVTSPRAGDPGAGDIVRELRELQGGRVPYQCVRMAVDTLSVVHAQTGDSASLLDVGPDAMWFRFGGRQQCDLSTRPLLRRLLAALVAAHPAPVSLDQLVTAGWPDERMRAESAERRIRVAVATLRRLGLATAVVTAPRAYGIDPAVRVQMHPAAPLPEGGSEGGARCPRAATMRR